MYGSAVPTKLCPYFWSTVLSIVILSWLNVVFDLIEKYTRYWTFPEFNIGLFRFLEKHSSFTVNGLYAIMGGVGVAFYFLDLQIAGVMTLGSAIGGFLYLKFGNKLHLYTQRTTYKPTTAKSPSMAKEYFKAKHSLVCPSLDFVDIEKEDFNKQVRKIEQNKEEMKEDMKVFDEVSLALDNLTEDDKEFLDRKYNETKKKYGPKST